MPTSLASAFFLVFLLSATSAKKDLTTERRANGTNVVIASVSRLQDSCIFPNDFQFLRRIAWQESHDGTEFIQKNWDVSSGIWGTDSYVLQTVQNDTTNDQLAIIKGELANQFNISIDEYTWSGGDMEVPISSAAVSRAKLFAANPKLPMTLQDQANFWAQTYHQGKRDPTDFLKSMAKIPPCKTRGIDLMFVVDSSGSIDQVPGAFDNARKFVITVIKGLDIGNHATRVGVVDFSSTAQLVTTFSGDKQAVIDAVQNMDDMDGNTATGDALVMATNEFIHRARDPSKGYPMVTILITDGQPNWGTANATVAAEDMKKNGITLFTIGIANADLSNLQQTASNPKCLHFYVLDAYANLAAEFPEVLLSQTCTVSASIPPNVHSVNSSVDQGQSAYFRLKANVSDGVTLKVSTQVGDTTIYASLTSTLPSSADYDFKADAPMGSLGQIFITPEDLEAALPPNHKNVDIYQLSDVPEEEKGQTVTVFSAVYGKQATNNFTMYIDDGNTVVTTTTTTTPSTTTATATTTASTPSTPVTTTTGQAKGAIRSGFNVFHLVVPICLLIFCANL